MTLKGFMEEEEDKEEREGDVILKAAKVRYL